MNLMGKKIGFIAVLLLFFAQAALAAALPNQVTNVRFSQRAEAVRIVFDLENIPVYKITTANNGTRIIIDMPTTLNKTALKNLTINDSVIKSVLFSVVDKDTFRTTIDLNQNVVYKVNQLDKPNRFYIDIIKNYDQKLIADIAPGFQHITIIRSNEKGALTAHILDIDPKAGYQFRPALAGGIIAGREALSAISARNQAVAAINASYFATSGELLGITKIDSTVVSTTYLTRSAFGIAADGKPMIGQVGYNGTVSLADGTMVPVSGVNCERGEDGLVLYNAYYNMSTKSNQYGREYVVKNNQVIAINQADSPLNADSIVVSAHGASMEKLASVEVGDPMNIVEDLGPKWNEAIQILGVGPMLVKNNSVYLTTKNEEFGNDVAGGRAPRTAVGITKDQHVLLVVVDGRQEHSIGYTLLELALFMQEMGAVDAVNFDGGGSSEMMLKNEMINRPSDGNERKIGSALVVLGKSS